MEKITLVMEFEPKTMEAVRRIAQEDEESIETVLYNFLLKGLAYRAARGPEKKKLVVGQTTIPLELPAFLK